MFLNHEFFFDSTYVKRYVLHTYTHVYIEGTSD